MYLKKLFLFLLCTVLHFVLASFKMHPSVFIFFFLRVKTKDADTLHANPWRVTEVTGVQNAAPTGPSWRMLEEPEAIFSPCSLRVCFQSCSLTAAVIV